jgi:hypothetical protein
MLSNKFGWYGPCAPPYPFGVNWESRQADGLMFWVPYSRWRSLHAASMVDSTSHLIASLGNATTIVQDSVFGYGINFANDFSKAVFADPKWFTGFAGLTVAVWTRPTGISGALFSKTTSLTATSGTFCLSFSATNNLRWAVVNASASRVALDAGGTWTAKNLYLIVGTYDGAALRAYQNGVQIGSTAAQTGLVQTTTTPLNLGNINDSGAGMRGALLDIRIYNRALSADVIRQMYDPATRFELYRPFLPRFFSVSVAAPPAAGRVYGPAAQ